MSTRATSAPRAAQGSQDPAAPARPQGHPCPSHRGLGGAAGQPRWRHRCVSGSIPPVNDRIHPSPITHSPRLRDRWDFILHGEEEGKNKRESEGGEDRGAATGAFGTRAGAEKCLECSISSPGGSQRSRVSRGSPAVSTGDGWKGNPARCKKNLVFSLSFLCPISSQSPSAPASLTDTSKGPVPFPWPSVPFLGPLSPSLDPCPLSLVPCPFPLAPCPFPLVLCLLLLAPVPFPWLPVPRVSQALSGVAALTPNTAPSVPGGCLGTPTCQGPSQGSTRVQSGSRANGAGGKGAEQAQLPPRGHPKVHPTPLRQLRTFPGLTPLPSAPPAAASPPPCPLPNDDAEVSHFPSPITPAQCPGLRSGASRGCPGAGPARPRGDPGIHTEPPSPKSVFGLPRSGLSTHQEQGEPRPVLLGRERAQSWDLGALSARPGAAGTPRKGVLAEPRLLSSFSGSVQAQECTWSCRARIL